MKIIRNRSSSFTWTCLECFNVHEFSHISLQRDDWVSSSHLKAVDVWILLCYLEVFFALIEYCLVLYLIKGDYYWEPKANQVQNETNEEAAAEYVRTLMLLQGVPE